MIVFPDGFYQRLPKRSKVSPTLRSKLTIHESIIIFSVLIAVSQGKFDILTLQMNNRIDRILVEILLQKVIKTVFGKILFTVKIDD